MPCLLVKSFLSSQHKYPQNPTIFYGKSTSHVASSFSWAPASAWVLAWEGPRNGKVMKKKTILGRKKTCFLKDWFLILGWESLTCFVEMLDGIQECHRKTAFSVHLSPTIWSKLGAVNSHECQPSHPVFTIFRTATWKVPSS